MGSSGGNMGSSGGGNSSGGGSNFGGGGGGNNPPHINFGPGTNNILNRESVDPIKTDLTIVYEKLSQLINVNDNLSPNRGLTMSSKNLQNLEFNGTDRLTMYNHIVNHHPNLDPNIAKYISGVGVNFNYCTSINTKFLNLFKSY